MNLQSGQFRVTQIGVLVDECAQLKSDRVMETQAEFPGMAGLVSLEAK